MVNPTIVKDGDTLWSWVWIHHGKDTLQPLHELVTIITTNLDVCIDNSIDGGCRQNRISIVLCKQAICSMIRLNVTYQVPQTKQHCLWAFNPLVDHPFNRYDVRMFTAASSLVTRYSGGSPPIVKAKSCQASSQCSAAIFESFWKVSKKRLM
jgi:hypothetical protein